MNKANLSLILILLSASANAALWYDSDTSDSFYWNSRIPVILNESLGVDRIKEPVIVSLTGLNYSSLRVVDPQALPDEEKEVYGNDIPYQINGDELLFLGNVLSRRSKIYYVYFSDDPIERRFYPPQDLIMSHSRYGISVENSKALWEISERGYYFSVSRYENKDFNGSITAAQGLEWGERITSGMGWEGFPAYGGNWNCSTLDSGPIRLRINCSTNLYPYNLIRVYSFYSENAFFEVEEHLDIFDEEWSDSRLQVRNRVDALFNESCNYCFSRYVGDGSFYMAARDVVNSTGGFVFWVMGKGNFSDVGFRKQRSEDSFDYVLRASHNASGIVRFLFREGGILEARREFERFIRPLAYVKPMEYNSLSIFPIPSYDRFYDRGFVVVQAGSRQVYGTDRVDCRIGDNFFALFDDGSHGDLLALDNLWTNKVSFQVTERTPTGEYTVLCEALDRKGNSVSSSSTFPVFDHGSYHNIVFSAGDVRIRPSGSARIPVNVSNLGHFSESEISFGVDAPIGWSISLPEGFDLGINETRNVFIVLSSPSSQALGSIPLTVSTRSRDSIESSHRISVDVELFDVEFDSQISGDEVSLRFLGDDLNPVAYADVLVTHDDLTSSYVTDADGLLSFRADGAAFLEIDVIETGYKPFSIKLGLREKEVSYWFPVSAFIIILLTLFFFRLYWRMPDRDYMEDAFVIALVIGVFITLAWVGFTMRGKESFTALYFPEDSYSGNLSGDSTSFRYAVDCWEHKPTSYNLSVFLGYQLVDVDSFRLGVGDSLQVRYLEREKKINVPLSLGLPARVRLVLSGGNRSYDIHFFLRNRVLNVSNVSVNVTCVDGLLDGDESDLDCGGSCVPCSLDQDCVSHLDCLSGFCLRRACSEPTCFDGVMNQGEQMMDCGGPCLPCHCFNLVTDLDESDIDCGGSCTPCSLDQKCVSHLDCLSGFCFSGLCRTSTCDDKIWGPSELEIDCGGPCPPCPSCFDGVMNQDEIDVDCGGSCVSCDLLYENRTHVSLITELEGFISSLSFDSDGSHVVVASNGLEGYVSLLENGILMWTQRIPSALTDVRFLDGDRFVSPYPGADVYLLDLNGVNRMPSFMDKAATAGIVCGVSRGSEVFFVFNRSQNRWIYSVDSQIRRFSFTDNCSHRVEGYRLSENFSSVRLFEGKNRLWDHSVRDDVYSVDVSYNGSFVAVGAGGRHITDDNFIYFFDRGGRLLWKRLVDWNIYSLSLSDDGGFVLAGSRSGVVYLFNGSGSLLWSYESGSSVLDLELSSDGKQGVFGTSSGRLYYVSNPLVNCSDGILNMGESDVDCGGPCPPCRVGMWCRSRSDCLSGFCLNGLCRTPTCDDGVRNQGEQWIDCGGPCLPCKPRCFRDSDCGRDFVSEPYCFGEFVLEDDVSFSCVDPGVVESYCDVYNETRLVEACVDSVCIDGRCV
ncbi:MAG: hypothetical protein JW778_01820 [Candidatus Altiarchaeota archaeon]|nr:hypothetical protein [Candidatus Altiarchaeota archaeon]